jgi:hypothetical protein
LILQCFIGILACTFPKYLFGLELIPIMNQLFFLY